MSSGMGEPVMRKSHRNGARSRLLAILWIVISISSVRFVSSLTSFSDSEAQTRAFGRNSDRLSSAMRMRPSQHTLTHKSETTLSRLRGGLRVITEEEPVKPLKSASCSGDAKETSQNVKEYDYDFAVIGGGSGGMAAAKEAAKLGARVVLFDFVKPSTQGTTWGLGGTCVNVGCVPKKLMHYAALLGKSFYDAAKFGWNITSKPSHSWEQMRDSVQNHVRSLNFGYRIGLRKAGVKYMNALAKLEGDNTVSFVDKNGVGGVLTAKHILLAVGGRPRIPKEIPGALDLAITSDDIFSLGSGPKKVLVVGGSYIALETAGFLISLGIDVDIAVRSIVLRGFDRQCAVKIERNLKDIGANVMNGWVVRSLERKNNETSITATLEKRVPDPTKSDNNDVQIMKYDQVMFATGRQADLDKLGLENVGISQDPDDFKLSTKSDMSINAGLYAVGDIVKNGLELTPVAIRQGEILARNLFLGSNESLDLSKVATTVFTPIEYGCVGLSEEDAIKLHGEESIEVFLSEFTTLELAATHRMKEKPFDEYDADMPPNCLSKLICLKSEDMRVIGFHFVGPNAGEITQGFSLALALGAKKKDFDNMVGIHPTDAESFSSLDITRASGDSWVAAGGCGGGKCG